MATSGSSLAIATGIYAIILAACILFFSIWRRRQLTKKFYAPKRYLTADGHQRPPKLSTTLGGWVPQVLKQTEAEVIRCAGVDAAMYLKILRMGFEMFMLVGFLVLVIILPINCVGTEVDRLMSDPSTNVTDPTTGQKYTFTNLDKTTITNIPSRDASLWAHAVITWAASLVVYWWLWRYNKEALRLRIFYLLNQPAGAESHTALVQDIPGVAFGTIPNRADGTLLKLIPKSIKEQAFKQTAMLAEKGSGAVGSGVKAVPLGKHEAAAANNSAAAAALSSEIMVIDPTTGRWEMRDDWADAVNEIREHDGSVAAMVEASMRRIYGEDLSAVHMCHNTSKLDPLVAEYEKRKLALTDLVDNYISQKRRGKELKVKQTRVIGATMGAWGKEKYGMKPQKVEVLEFLRDRMTELRRAIHEEQEAALKPDHVYPAAFVTFHKRTSQVVASRTLMSEDLSTWRVQAAPRADEVVWPNLAWRLWERTARSLAMWAAFWAMAAFFMIPVTAVQGLLTMNSFLDFLNSIPIAGTFVTAMLPGLALKIFLILVPIIITIMNRFSGMVSVSQIDLGLVSRFFLFQVITVFLGSFIAGTFANQLNQFIEDPGSIITIFGTSAPQTAIFFMSYLLLAGFLQTAMTLMRIVPLIIFWVKSRFLAGTERAKNRLWQDQTMSFGTQVPDNTIAILLGLVFCTICPLITPVAAFYFAMNYIVWKYQMVYTYNGEYQSGGLVWTRVFDQVMVGMFFFHLMMVAILAIKKMVGPPILVALLWAFDYAFSVAVHKRFWRPQECLSLISAAEMDDKETLLLGAPGKGVDEAVKQNYLSPSFKFDEEEHAKVLEEAERMRKVVVEGAEDEALFAEEEEPSAHSNVALEADAAEAGRVVVAHVDDTAAGASVDGEAFQDAHEHDDAASARSQATTVYADAHDEPRGV